MDIATCVNKLDASTIQDVKKFKIQYIQVHTINVYSEFRNGKREFEYILWYLETVLKDLWGDNKFV